MNATELNYGDIVILKNYKRKMMVTTIYGNRVNGFLLTKTGRKGAILNLDISGIESKIEGE